MGKQKFEEKERKKQKTKEPAPQIKQHNNPGGNREGSWVPLLGR